MDSFPSRMLLLVLATAPAAALPGQELAWRISGRWNNYQYPQMSLGGPLMAMGDWDGDGFGDLLGFRGYWLPLTVELSLPGITIFSGRDGSVVHAVEGPFGLGALDIVPAGDVDGDGSPDYAASRWDPSPLLPPTVIEVRRLTDHSLIWSVVGPTVVPNGYGSVLLGGLDLDGDHRPDLVVVDTRSPVNGSNGEVFAHDNRGRLLWRILGPPGFFYANSLATLGDLDGDGCDDFVMACLESTARGAGVVVSGRTGTVIRIVYGELVGDNCSKNVVNAGDLDLDGVPDFALGGGRSSVQAFSAATGARLHVWRPQVPGSDFGWQLAGGVDLDQDGIPDLVASATLESVIGTPPGRIHALSGRDGSFLYSLRPDPGQSATRMGFFKMAVLPPQPGHPYPLFVYSEPDYGTGVNDWTRISCYRGNPRRVTPFGSGCGVSGPPPRIGMRPLPGGTAIHLSGAPPGSLAILALGLSNQQAPGGFPLPYDLSRSVDLGCQLLVSTDLLTPVFTGTQGIDAGYARIVLQRPIPAQGGIPLHAQWFAFGPAGFAGASAAHTFFLQ